MIERNLKNEYKEALNYAVKQLSYRDLSTKLLTEKLLSKGYSENITYYVTDYLCKNNFLNDLNYAISIANSYIRRGYGLLKIKQELKIRKINDEYISIALNQTTIDFNILNHLINKKLKGNISNKKEIQKTISFLQRRGFELSQIKTAIKLYIDENADIY